jgi:hypothetical protein
MEKICIYKDQWTYPDGRPAAGPKYNELVEVVETVVWGGRVWYRLKDYPTDIFYNSIFFVDGLSTSDLRELLSELPAKRELEPALC